MSLKENYQDAVLSSGTLRKYQIINNPDGTVSFQDVSQYSQPGDKAQASVFNATNHEINNHEGNAAVHITPLTCTKSGTVYALTGLTATAGKVSVLFAVPTAYVPGDTVTINGTAFALKTTDGTALTIGAWAIGIVAGIADVDAKTLTVYPSAPIGALPITGGTVKGTLNIASDSANLGYYAMIQAGLYGVYLAVFANGVEKGYLFLGNDDRMVFHSVTDGADYLIWNSQNIPKMPPTAFSPRNNAISTASPSGGGEGDGWDQV